MAPQFLGGGMVVLLYLLLLVSLPIHSRATDSQLDRLRSRVSVESVQAIPSEVAGVYSHAGDEVAGAPDNTGAKTALYLFPDGTYLFVQRAPVMPPTIFDKGAWRITSDVIELNSSREVIWNPDLERSFLIQRRTSHAEELLLVGTDLAVERFERLAGGDAESALLTVARRRKRTIEADRTTKLKDYLMKKAWHPNGLVTRL
jgi:hypothetical protein